MTDPLGVNLLPATGEWVYDTLPRRAAPAGATAVSDVNRTAAPGGTRTDCSLALDRLQALHPGCGTVALVVAWFANTTDAATCRVYPATVYSGGSAQALVSGSWVDEPWRCSGLTQASPGLIALSDTGAGAAYGGTPSDPAVVRCLRDCKARGLRTVFYPFLLMDAPGFPWRGRIGSGADGTQGAADAVAAFLGPATPALFTRDAANLTVSYAGGAADYSYRRMILHYANLCVLAGGVDLFLLGSELRGLEALRGPAWTKQGMVAADGTACWDYPFVAGLARLAGDVRAILDAAGLARDTAGFHNLVAYSADWSSWMGVQHSDANGQWPHLDALHASAAIDLVSFDNYLPLSDWTSGGGGLDAGPAWSAPVAAGWPPPPATMGNLGLPGTPTLASAAYLKANIEGGEGYAWFYRDGRNAGRGFDPAGSAQQVSLPVGDRLTQTRSAYAANQQILAPKQIRWWWNNPHRAVYDSGDGRGWAPHGPPTAWVPAMKSITFAEYGFPTCDRCTNQPNVFYDPRSSESLTPYWSAWDAVPGDAWRPRRDDTLARRAHDAFVEYWTSDGHNATSPAGVRMIETAFMCAWNWDARPFPAFPALGLWGDAPNWATGTWIDGKGPPVPSLAPDQPAPITAAPAFPTLAGRGWSTTWRTLFATQAALHASGREGRAARMATPEWEVTLTFEGLSTALAGDVAVLAGFYAARGAGALPFTLAPPPELGLPGAILCRFAEDTLDVETFAANLAASRALVLRSVKVAP